jgi:hypothetical protein
MENSMEVLQKIKALPNDSTILLLGRLPKEVKSGPKRNQHSYVYCSIIHNTQGI